jgi:predicted ATPase/class 3 adenylate cyclase
MADPRPSGTITFLFTDLEESARHWEEHPTAMGAALARHDALLRAAVARHGGVVFKTVGDAVYAAFAVAPAALAAALAAQRDVQAEDWGVVASLRVRMALHVGQAEERDGDYFGQPLNRVARLLGTGHGGQVLLSLAASELIRDHLPDGAGLRDLGEHRLRDLYRPERIAQLLAPDLPATFPPLRTLDRLPTNLPAQPTPFLGRERELTRAVALLRPGTDRPDPSPRLLTLTGPGGIGKTRLALQVAAELLDSFSDGAWFVDLAPLTDPALVPSVIATALGVQEEGDRPLLASLIADLQNKRLLLVLDNFEQVAAGAATVADLLAACPGLAVLATSRTRLRLRGEQELAVPPLALPEPGRPPSLERLTQYEAVALFIARARELRPDFAVTNENAPAVAAICARLDGLPLAIELAAARVKLLPPQAMLPRLERRLGLLTGGAWDLPVRQRTMRDAIAWSHDLLSEEEQTLFRRLAVFAGGCTMEAAEAVAGSDGGLDVLTGLAALVDGSLLREGEDPSGEPRFTMLETIREYALERLEASDEATPIRQRHTDWCLAFADRAPAGLAGSEQESWLGRVDAEHDNLRAALGWGRERGEVEQGLGIVVGLCPFWQMRGHLTEGRRWLASVLAGSAGAANETRSLALLCAGALAWRQGDAVPARTLFEEALALSRALGDRPGTGRALGNLGQVEWEQGNLPRAEALSEEALAIFRALGDTRGIAIGLLNLGALTTDAERARALNEESLALHRALEDRHGIAHVLNNLGVLARNAGDDGRARTLYEESLALSRALEDPRGIALALYNLGMLAWELGDVGRAGGYYDEALTLLRELGDRALIASCLEAIAEMAAPGQPSAAARLYGAAEALREAIGVPPRADYEASMRAAVTAVGAALGEEAFADAWAAGRAMSPEAASASAVAVARDLASPTG